MLANLRFVIGAALAIALLAVTALGLFAAVRMTHQTKIGPLELTSRRVSLIGAKRDDATMIGSAITGEGERPLDDA
jgi:hypothetical protein